MAKNPRNMGKPKIICDYEKIKEELRIIDMLELSNKMKIDNEYILIEKLITFADIPCYAKYCYNTEDKNQKNAFSKSKIEERVKKNKLFYSDINEMIKYEDSNKKEKLFFVQTKQANIALPNQFYSFLNKSYPNGKLKYTFDSKDGYNFFLVKKSLDEYFNPSITNKCLEKLGKEQIAKKWTDATDDYLKIQISVGDHGIGTKKDEIFHNLRSDVFARDKIILLIEKTKLAPIKYNTYIMFFRNPKFFSIMNIGSHAYSRILFNDNLNKKEESRQGQAKWRDMLAEYNLALSDDDIITCPISNLEVHYDDEGTILRASHIKEYVKCKDENGNILCDEAYDINNGLLIVANADALFDKHMISINPINGKITYSKLISTALKKQLNFNDKIDSKYLTDDRLKYLLIHWNEFNNLESKRK